MYYSGCLLAVVGAFVLSATLAHPGLSEYYSGHERISHDGHDDHGMHKEEPREHPHTLIRYKLHDYHHRPVAKLEDIRGDYYNEHDHKIRPYGETHYKVWHQKQ